MSSANDSPIGLIGLITVSTRGSDGPGEVSLRMRGGSETYLATSERPLVRGTRVVVITMLGPRSVLVDPVEGYGGSSLDLSEGI
jgi:hypothetical protein